MAAVECKSCEHVFELTEQRHYIAREKTEMFLIVSNKMEPTLYDAFDCPICGCQYIANERKRVFSKGDKNDTVRSYFCPPSCQPGAGEENNEKEWNYGYPIRISRQHRKVEYSEATRSEGGIVK